jgi:hypothetical protein
MNTRFKAFASYNILQHLCDFIHVLISVTVSKCRKSPKLTNIVIGALRQPRGAACCEEIVSADEHLRAQRGCPRVRAAAWVGAVVGLGRRLRAPTSRNPAKQNALERGGQGED